MADEAGGVAEKRGDGVDDMGVTSVTGPCDTHLRVADEVRGVDVTEQRGDEVDDGGRHVLVVELLAPQAGLGRVTPEQHVQRCRGGASVQ